MRPCAFSDFDESVSICSIKWEICPASRTRGWTQDAYGPDHPDAKFYQNVLSAM